MCGIAGIVSGRSDVERDVVLAMRDTLSHRGPDDAGVWISPDGRVGLGHRRLSILDLSPRGHQPMSDLAGEVWIVYNGEVYNFRRLREELLSAGERFTSDTDTEVILRAYRRWGIGCVDRLEGMFAMAIHDTRSGETFLVRDRLGIKPLCYAIDAEGALSFGSEIRAVLAGGRVSSELSGEAAWDYFTYGYVPTPATIYRAIRKLPPGCFLRFVPGGKEPATPVRYWQPRWEQEDLDVEHAAGQLREHIDRAVDACLVADVPVGSYLSGGLDSSIVTGRASEAYHRPDADQRRIGGSTLRTFSIGFDVAEHTELPFARQAAERFGTEHTELTVTREMAHQFDRTILDLFDEPFAASSTIPMTFLAKLARRETTVCLCGEGGDETFGGYSWYRSWQRLRGASFWGTGLGQATRQAVEFLLGRPKRKWRQAAMEDVELYADLMGAVSAVDKAAIFAPQLAETMATRDNAAYFREHWRDELPPLARMQRVDLMTFLPDLNLTRADRTSMHFSLELRVPLLNHELVEFCTSLPQRVRNPAGQLKGLLKTALADRVPESIRTRKKKGFSAPVKHWFDTDDLLRLIADLRVEKPDLAADWLNPRLAEYAGRVKGSRAYKLWVFLQWLRRHG
ncbi:MAG: asparagine synthase (glutamine-hydrolyzing) [Phycisphaerae bacterium]